MNIHSRLIGAFDGLILSLTAFVTIALLSGAVDSDHALPRGTVEIHQLDGATDQIVCKRACLP